MLSDVAEVLYNTTDYYAPQHDRYIHWNDPDLAIAWPIQGEPVISAKARSGKLLPEAQVFA